VRAVGYIFPPGLHHLYVDDVWEAIGRESGYWTTDMDVMVRHRHVLKGDAAADETHKKVYGTPGEPQRIYRACSCGDPKCMYCGPFIKQGSNDPITVPVFAGGLWANDQGVFKEWLEDERHIAVEAARKLRPVHVGITPASAGHSAELEKPEYFKTRKIMERVDYLKTCKVMILTPHGHRPVWQYADSYGATVRDFERLGIEWDRRRVPGMSNIPKARNFLAAQFMAAKTKDGGHYTHALLIDDDMHWFPQSPLQLLASKHDVIAGIGRKKDARPNSDPGVWCFYAPPEALMEWDDMQNFTTVGTKAGAAFMVVQRGVFEAMMAAHPEWKRPLPGIDPEIAKYYYQFFRNDPDDENDGGEDFCFCERWNALGGRVWIDPSIELGHVGEATYSGVLGDLLRPYMDMPAAS
jgi:hypothetical protein